MPKPSKTVTVVVSGDYHGPKNQSTGGELWEAAFGPGLEVTISPRFVISNLPRDEDSFLFFVNRRLGGDYQIVQDNTSLKENDSSR